MSRWDWLGLTERRWRKEPDEEIRPAKTAWDWLQVAVVPIVLVIIALAFNASQTARDRKRDEERTRQDRALALEARRDATLETYLTRMSNLMLDRKLFASRPGSDVRALARTLTLTTLRRLDGVRRAEVVRFLAESHLIDTAARKRPPRCAFEDRLQGCAVDLPPSVKATDVDLRGADLRHVALSNAELVRISLAETDLRNATFDNARLNNVRLNDSDMRHASFRGARIEAGMMARSRLDGAHFDGAEVMPGGPDVAARQMRQIAARLGRPLWWRVRSDLSDTCLTKASFVGAKVYEARLSGADGLATNFSGATFVDVATGYTTLGNANLQGTDGAPSAWSGPPRPSLGPGTCPPNVP